jgi:hypothetical protein
VGFQSSYGTFNRSSRSAYSGLRPFRTLQGFHCFPRALPWADELQPFGLRPTRPPSTNCSFRAS